jgi:two-component system, LytTR family, response regulator LytT
MTCIIIEDELPAQQVLLSYLEKTPSLQCLGVFNSATKVPLNLLNQVEIIFLDIQMPEITGIDFVKSFKNNAKIIITTAYRDYAIDAFEVAVEDYLLKPFSYPRFLKAVLKAQDSLKTGSLVDEENEIFVYADKIFHKIIKSDIFYVQAQVDYISIVHSSGKLLVQDSLNNWEIKFKGSNLIRVHRSFIVNVKKINRIQGNQIMMDETVIPIGGAYRDQLFEKINI